MVYKKGARIGGTCFFTHQIYVGTVRRVRGTFYWIDVDGGGVMPLDIGFDNIKPVCKSRGIVYV